MDEIFWGIKHLRPYKPATTVTAAEKPQMVQHQQASLQNNVMFHCNSLRTYFETLSHCHLFKKGD